MRKLTLLLVALTLAACQSTPKEMEQPRRSYDMTQGEMFETSQFDVYDPIEGTNKQIYKFNALADEYVLIPVSDAYKFVTPRFVRKRVTNFFGNVGEFSNFTNSVLQLKPEGAGTALGRFGLNTTVGLLGTFDVASEIGLDKKSQDFGKTLAYYGVDKGPYLIVPVFGPSNLRDFGGKIVDAAAFSAAVPNDVENSLGYEIAFYGLQPINARAENPFHYFQSGTPFEYELLRYISTTARQLQVDGNNAEGVMAPDIKK